MISCEFNAILYGQCSSRDARPHIQRENNNNNNKLKKMIR